MIDDRNKGRGLSGFLSGLFLGGALGVLFAPSEGTKSREALKKGLDDLKNDPKVLVDKVKDRAESTIEDVKESVEERLNQTRDNIEEKVEGARDDLKRAKDHIDSDLEEKMDNTLDKEKNKLKS